jgi:hypothetical protein
MSHWTSVASNLERGTQQVRFLMDGRPAEYGAVLDALGTDAAFRTFLLDSLRAVRYAAFFWETPPVTALSLRRPFEYVAIAASWLVRTVADPSAFGEHLATAPVAQGAVAFPSHRGDALLIAPTSRAEHAAYAHLGAFVRAAPAQQQHQLVEVVAQAMRGRLGSAPTWLSTAGLGVPWLHVRLDSTPKYYRFDPYRRGEVPDGAT